MVLTDNDYIYIYIYIYIYYQKNWYLFKKETYASSQSWN